MGSTTDEHGHSRPVAFMQYRINGQYIMEGLVSSFMFTLGKIAFKPVKSPSCRSSTSCRPSRARMS